VASARNAVHHYNIDYRIYRLFLDSDLQYSAPISRTATRRSIRRSLPRQHIAAKLLLEPGLKVLDIGSGWGGLGLHLARKPRFGGRHQSVRRAGADCAATRRGGRGRVRVSRSGLSERLEKFDRIVSSACSSTSAGRTTRRSFANAETC
jgi:cyclopropane-fatty-acyl-phospholipid synthase